MGIKKNKKQKEEKQKIIKNVGKLPYNSRHAENRKAIFQQKSFSSRKGKTRKEIPHKQEEISKDEYLYVYGITNKEDIKLNLKGLKDKPIQKFEIKDISVLFSFYPALHPMINEKEAMLHVEILNKIAGKTTVIPMAFGTVFKDQEILERVLETSYHIVKRTLELIKNKIELGIKVVKKEPKEIPEEVNKEILEELNKLSIKSIQGDKFSDRLLLNHSFLVEKKKFTQFSEKVGELEEKYQNLKFLYTGPWPAYSFVNINIKVG